MSSKELDELTENVRILTNEALDCLKFGQSSRAKQLFGQISWLRWRRDDLRLKELEVNAARNLLEVNGAVARVFDRGLLLEVAEDLDDNQIQSIMNSEEWKQLTVVTDEDKAKVQALIEGLRGLA